MIELSRMKWVDGTCSTQGAEDKCIQNFSQENWKEETTLENWAYMRG